LGLSHHAEYLRMYQMQIACQSSWHALLEYWEYYNLLSPSGLCMYNVNKYYYYNIINTLRIWKLVNLLPLFYSSRLSLSLMFPVRLGCSFLLLLNSACVELLLLFELQACLLPGHYINGLIWCSYKYSWSWSYLRIHFSVYPKWIEKKGALLWEKNMLTKVENIFIIVQKKTADCAVQQFNYLTWCILKLFPYSVVTKDGLSPPFMDQQIRMVWVWV
jgi:hypothetical protein